MSCPARFATARTPTRKTHGPRVALIAETFNTPLMPWQRQVADVALEVNPLTGHLAYREVIVTVPRQSGKTSLLLPVMVYRCMGAFGDRQRIIYTAQDRNKALAKFRDEHVQLLNRSALKGMFHPNMSHGEERVIWPATDSIHKIDASKDTSGHGDVLDMGVIDEAFARPDDTVEGAMKPAMITRKDAQLWIVSTAGTAKSKYLRSKVDTGRALVGAGRNTGTAYFEWSAPDGIDVFDESTWSSFMPALGHTINADNVRSERDSMRPAEFARAFGNVFDDQRSIVAVIPAEVWADCLVADAEPAGQVFWAVDTSPDRVWTALAAAGYTADGRELVDVGEHRTGSARWVLPRLLDLAGSTGCWDVTIRADGPAAALNADLTDAGFKVRLIGPAEQARACGAFLEAALSTDDGGRADRLAHRGQLELDEALSVAERSRRGDVWVWSHASSVGDITPLWAATLARHALSEGAPCRQGLGIG